MAATDLVFTEEKQIASLSWKEQSLCSDIDSALDALVDPESGVSDPRKIELLAIIIEGCAARAVFIAQQAKLDNDKSFV